MPTELAIVTFSEQAQAEQSLEKLKGLDEEQLVTVLDAVILEKDADGECDHP